jgi:hypothetical protein
MDGGGLWIDGLADSFAAVEPRLHFVPQSGLVVRGDAVNQRGVSFGLRREVRRGNAGAGVGRRVFARLAGTCWVSIGTALVDPEGRVSRDIPGSSVFSMVGFDQRYGMKEVTGPLKLPLLRNSIQQLLLIGTFLPTVVFFGAVSGSGRFS